MSWENHWEGVVVGVLVAAVLFGIGVWYMKHLQRQRQGSPPPSSSSSSPPRRKTATPSYPRGSLPGSFEGDANSARRSGVEAPPSPAQVGQRLLVHLESVPSRCSLSGFRLDWSDKKHLRNRPRSRNQSRRSKAVPPPTWAFPARHRRRARGRQARSKG